MLGHPNRKMALTAVAAPTLRQSTARLLLVAPRAPAYGPRLNRPARLVGESLRALPAGRWPRNASGTSCPFSDRRLPAASEVRGQSNLFDGMEELRNYQRRNRAADALIASTALGCSGFAGCFGARFGRFTMRVRRRRQWDATRGKHRAAKLDA